MDAITRYNKAIVAFLVPLLTYLAGTYGFNWDGETIATIATLASTLLVYLVPNKGG